MANCASGVVMSNAPRLRQSNGNGRTTVCRLVLSFDPSPFFPPMRRSLCAAASRPIGRDRAAALRWLTHADHSGRGQPSPAWRGPAISSQTQSPLDGGDLRIGHGLQEEVQGVEVRVRQGIDLLDPA